MRHTLPTASLVLALLAHAPAHAQNGPPTPPARPLHTFSSNFTLRGYNLVAVGNGSGPTLEVTSLTFTNYTQSTHQVIVTQVATDGHSCSGSFGSRGDKPHMSFMVPPNQTMHFVFPTPLDVPHFLGVSCLGFQVGTNLDGGALDVLVNGFSQ